MTTYGLSSFLHSEGINLVSTFRSYFAWLECSIIEPEFCRQMRPYRLESSPLLQKQKSTLQYYG